MVLSVKEIENNSRYRLILSLPYNEIVPFVLTYIKKRTLPLFIASILLSISLISICLFRLEIAGDYRWIDIFRHSIIGFIIIPLLLIVPHELLHVIPYYFSGARDIRIGAKWRDAYFYVTANRHPVNRFWFIIIALTPTIAITALLVLLLPLVPPLWQWSLLCTIFAHYTMCAGDFALINFYFINRRLKIITWDDAKSDTAYFYEEKE
jgi:hypothetical protein